MPWKERRPDLDLASMGNAPLTQPREVRLVARQAEEAERELLAVWLQACDWTLGKPTRTSCAISGAAAKLRRFGSGLGFVGCPVGNNTGDFLLALG
jgi:hypothetical protein